MLAPVSGRRARSWTGWAAGGGGGAGGALAPLARLALAMIGEGEVRLDGRRLPAAVALEEAGLRPVVLAAKEGVALINGTQLMTACGALAGFDARALAACADVAGGGGAGGGPPP